MKFNDGSLAYFHLHELDLANSSKEYHVEKTDQTLIWNTGDSFTFSIDGIKHMIENNQVFSLTGGQRINIMRSVNAGLISFNQTFYSTLKLQN